uniref:Cytosolic Fe-S cluster assembly factor NUBP2 homolog n=2 Tax=Tetranychus urticae TaxID=32264 RepID=T1KFP3_TETUR
MGKKVGLLDLDLCGPSIALMTGLNETTIYRNEKGWIPLTTLTTPPFSPLAVMSIAFLLKNSSSAVIWRGPKKNAMIKQFLEDVDWGDLDYLLIDTPPGTSDEHISVAEALKHRADDVSAILVTTPQIIAVNDVRREITFCHKAGIPIVGIIENMSGYVCPHCSDCTNIFSSGGGQSLAELANVTFLGNIPIDPDLCESAEKGINYLNQFENSEASKRLSDIAGKLITQTT